MDFSRPFIDRAPAAVPLAAKTWPGFRKCGGNWPRVLTACITLQTVLNSGRNGPTRWDGLSRLPCCPRHTLRSGSSDVESGCLELKKETKGCNVESCFKSYQASCPEIWHRYKPVSGARNSWAGFERFPLANEHRCRAGYWGVCRHLCKGAARGGVPGEDYQLRARPSLLRAAAQGYAQRSPLVR